MSIARRNLGEKRAFEILATGKTFSAEEAAEIGFINRVCDDADFESEVEKYGEISQPERLGLDADEAPALPDRFDEL